MTSAKIIFISYSHFDEEFKDKVVAHLGYLEHQGVALIWHDRQLDPGCEWDNSIKAKLNEANVILLLVSQHFLKSRYCRMEVDIAMARHEAREAIVIPVILRSCSWKDEPFGRLNAFPTDGRPVQQWKPYDVPLHQVSEAVKSAIKTKNPIASFLYQQPKPESAVRSQGSQNFSKTKTRRSSRRGISIYRYFLLTTGSLMILGAAWGWFLNDKAKNLRELDESTANLMPKFSAPQDINSSICPKLRIINKAWAEEYGSDYFGLSAQKKIYQKEISKYGDKPNEQVYKQSNKNFVELVGWSSTTGGWFEQPNFYRWNAPPGRYPAKMWIHVPARDLRLLFVQIEKCGL